LCLIFFFLFFFDVVKVFLNKDTLPKIN